MKTESIKEEIQTSGGLTIFREFFFPNKGMDTRLKLSVSGNFWSDSEKYGGNEVYDIKAFNSDDDKQIPLSLDDLSFKDIIELRDVLNHFIGLITTRKEKKVCQDT